MNNGIKLELNRSQWLEFRGENRVVFSSHPLGSWRAERILSLDSRALHEELKTSEQYDDLVLLVQTSEGLYFRSDLTNSRPIFYDKESCWVSDQFPTDSSLEVDDIAASEYLRFGYVTGDRTLLTGVRRSQAAEFISLQPGRFSRWDLIGYQYAQSVLQKETVEPVAEIDRFLEALDASIQNSLSMLEGRERLIVPLSGGHDSRLLLSQLFRLGFRNVICFSYGEPGNLQSEISRRVATALGFPWYFVEYTDENWRELVERGLIREYLLFAHRGVSTPHLLDFLAIHELMVSGIVRKSDIVLPGHTLDFLAGGHFGELDLNCHDLSGAVNHIITRHSYFSDRRSSDPSAIHRRLRNKLGNISIPPEHLQEWFNWRERQTKFILNSCQTYSFFGLKYATPFWGAEVVRYWLSVPPGIKRCRKLYFQMEPMMLDHRLKAIPFADNDLSVVKKRKQRKRNIFHLVPASFISSAVSLIGRRANLNEGMNRIFSGSARIIEDLVPILSSHRIGASPPVKDVLKRRPYQLNPSRLTTLVTLELLLQTRKSNPARYH